MRRLLTAATLPLLLAAPTLASGQTAMSPKDATPGQVVTTPLNTLNIKKDAIPPILQQARAQPYAVAGLRKCPAIQAEVTRLDAALGDDFDVAADKHRRPGVGNIAKSVVSSLIPFGGVIREISGANESQRQWQLAIYAGVARRSFLKGYGQMKGCRYPARPAAMPRR